MADKLKIEIANELLLSSARAGEINIRKITDELVFFTADKRDYSARINKSGKLKKNSISLM